MEDVLTGPPGRGLPFMDDMVRAVHAGLKSETRRVIADDPTATRSPCISLDRKLYQRLVSSPWDAWKELSREEAVARFARYPKPGGTMWMQENLRRDGSFTVYAADGMPVRNCQGEKLVETRWPWKRDTMRAGCCPRWAWRTPLLVTALRAHPLEELTAEEAWAEGLLILHTRAQVEALGGPVACYLKLWDKLNAKRGYGSTTRPWCWALGFRRYTRAEVDALPMWPQKAAIHLGHQHDRRAVEGLEEVACASCG